jgi:MinD-like ATPase involved in chromosome partitioning or flagellar assembly
MVGVSSADGGVGRSTLVAALGGLLALACPTPVVAVDVTVRAWGGLGDRVGRTGPGTIWDAVAAGEQLDPQVLAHVTQSGPTGLRTLVGEVEMTSRRRPPTVLEVAVTVGRLRAWAPLVVLDLPTAETAGIWQALGWSAAPVLVARATQESVRHTLRLIAALRAGGLGATADAAVVVVMATSPMADRQVRAAERQMSGVVGAVVRVPYDAALARCAPVDPRSLRRTTRAALVEVAAAVLAHCPADPQLAAQLLQPSEGTSTRGGTPA